MLPNRGFAQMTAIKILIQATFLPIFTKEASDTCCRCYNMIREIPVYIDGKNCADTICH